MRSPFFVGAFCCRAHLCAGRKRNGKRKYPTRREYSIRHLKHVLTWIGMPAFPTGFSLHRSKANAFNIIRLVYRSQPVIITRHRSHLCVAGKNTVARPNALDQQFAQQDMRVISASICKHNRMAGCDVYSKALLAILRNFSKAQCGQNNGIGPDWISNQSALDDVARMCVDRILTDVFACSLNEPLETSI